MAGDIKMNSSHSGQVHLNSVYIEITDTCNLHCSFCPSSTLGEKRHFMDAGIFSSCIKSIAGVADSVYFHILGEPLLHPNFEQFLHALDGTGLQLNLTTNGTLLPKMEDVLLASKSLRQINFSSHAYSELPPESAKHHFENLLNFAAKAIEVRPELYINLRLWNVGDEGSSIWNHYVLDQIENRFSTTINLDNFCSRHKSFLIKERLYIHQDSRFEWPSNEDCAIKAQSKEATSQNSYPKGSCRALDTHVGILHDGRVVACCLDHGGAITLGNIQENSLQEILLSPLATSLREGFANRELRHPFCQNCKFCKRFK